MGALPTMPVELFAFGWPGGSFVRTPQIRGIGQQGEGGTKREETCAVPSDREEALGVKVTALRFLPFPGLSVAWLRWLPQPPSDVVLSGL